jgi:hypothetical protein
MGNGIPSVSFFDRRNASKFRLPLLTSLSPTCLRTRVAWDRCYDFKNIFAKKFGEKIGGFDSKRSQILLNFDHKTPIFSPKTV